jgi:hypothetical protein
MDQEEIKNRAKTNSFYVALIYVGVGTSLLFIWTGHDNDLIVIVYSILALLTLPVTFIGWGITYSEADRPTLLILGIQLIIFFIFWLVVYRYLVNKYTREERIANKDQEES